MNLDIDDDDGDSYESIDEDARRNFSKKPNI